MIKFSNQISQDKWYLTVSTNVLAPYTIYLIAKIMV